MNQQALSTQDHYFMRQAILIAKKGIKSGQTPFGACIVKDGKIIALEHNQVWKKMDVVAHAEITAIRKACQKLKTLHLSQCTIYSTCEPCPMCFAACHWARITRIVFGATINDAKSCGFNELRISNHHLKRIGQIPIKIKSGVLGCSCRQLFKLWMARQVNRPY